MISPTKRTFTVCDNAACFLGPCGPVIEDVFFCGRNIGKKRKKGNIVLILPRNYYRSHAMVKILPKVISMGFSLNTDDPSDNQHRKTILFIA
jgi:hypothetical protein